MIESDFFSLKHLRIYVFDDTEPDDAEYLGLASGPLIPLAHDQAISGSFELKRVFTSLHFLSFYSHL